MTNAAFGGFSFQSVAGVSDAGCRLHRLRIPPQPTSCHAQESTPNPRALHVDTVLYASAVLSDFESLPRLKAVELPAQTFDQIVSHVGWVFNQIRFLLKLYHAVLVMVCRPSLTCTIFSSVNFSLIILKDFYFQLCASINLNNVTRVCSF